LVISEHCFYVSLTTARFSRSNDHEKSTLRSVAVNVDLSRSLRDREQLGNIVEENGGERVGNVEDDMEEMEQKAQGRVVWGGVVGGL